MSPEPQIPMQQIISIGAVLDVFMVVFAYVGMRVMAYLNYKAMGIDVAQRIRNLDDRAFAVYAGLHTLAIAILIGFVVS